MGTGHLHGALQPAEDEALICSIPRSATRVRRHTLVGRLLKLLAPVCRPLAAMVRQDF